MTLCELKTNEVAIIVSVNGMYDLGCLGFIKNQRIVMKGAAPWGGPLLIKVGESLYAIRKEHAKKIDIRRI